MVLTMSHDPRGGGGGDNDGGGTGLDDDGWYRRAGMDPNGRSSRRPTTRLPRTSGDRPWTSTPHAGATSGSPHRRGVDLRKAEREAFRERPVRCHVLALDEQPGHLTEGEPEGEARRREDRRPMQHAAERPSTARDWRRVWARSVVDALRALVLENPLEHVEQIVEVNPRNHCRPSPTGPPTPSRNRPPNRP